MTHAPFADLPPPSPAPRVDDDGPPPPPAPPGSEREARATAATWVAATGALLLLAAAGTFLAVSWDTLGLTARVGIVAAGTGAAILGGHRLRRQLPAVGAVLFHLGAFLVPIDVLGLALQLDAGPATRWMAVGATATFALPVLAAAGRSSVLRWGAVAGVPVLATGIGLAGVVVGAAPLFVAVAAALMAIVFALASGSTDARDHDASRSFAGAAWMLGAAAVHLPAVVAVIAAIPGTGGALDQVSQAGWLPTSWELVVTTGAVAVSAIAVSATRLRARWLATLAVTSAAVTVLAALIPASTPRAVLVVLPAAVVALIQAAAVGARTHALWGAPTRLLAIVAEWLALAAAGPAVVAALVHAYLLTSGDRPFATAMGLLAAAWAVGAARRVLTDGRHARIVPFLVGMAVTQTAVAMLVAGLPVELAVAVLLSGAGATLVWWPADPAAPQRGAAGPGAALVAVAACGLAGLLAANRPVIAVIVLVTALVTGLHVRATGAGTADGPLAATLWLLVPTAVLTVLLGAGALAQRTDALAGWAALVAAGSLLVMAALSDLRPPVADGIRAVALLVGLVATSTLIGSGFLAPAGRTVPPAADVLGLGPAALLPSAVVAGWLVLDALRLRRSRLAAFAAPVAVRFLASAGLVLVADPRTTGHALLLLGAAAAMAGAVGVGRWTAPAVVLAVSAVTVGVPLAGVTPELRAGLLIAAGLTVAAAGATRSNGVVGHLGGALAVIGSWQLFGLWRLEALDIWILPLAAQLWVAGIAARRRGGTSSWVADVPPLLLVAVSALVERASGGGGWHAVLAGGLGVAAVIAGGSERLGGPLVIGTAVLVAVVGIETFAVVAAVPTWVWLGVGGATLLGAGAAMEHVGGSPATAARRLVDVVRERFD